MKKKILISLSCLLLTIAGYTLLTSAYKKKDAGRNLKEANKLSEFVNGLDSGYLSSLGDIGFTSIKNVKLAKYITLRKEWRRNNNVSFLGDEEMTMFLNDNDFIIGPANRFLDEIPKNAGYRLISKYQELADSLTMYYLHIYNPFDMTYCLTADCMAIKPEKSISFKEEESFIKYLKPSTIKEYKIPPPYVWDLNVVKPEIKIIAGAKSFNTEGMQLKERILKAIVPVDPIAVIKVDDGWIEIASW